jgi:hypothetical protein
MARRRGLITISHPAPIDWRRKRTASRTRRRILFRTTAPPRARGQVNPTLAPLSPLFRKQNAENSGPENFAPLSYTLRKSLERRMRAVLGKPAMPLPISADGELFSPARTAASQHSAAVLGGHTGEKTVRLHTFAVIRLKSTFRHLDCPARRGARLCERPFELSI